MPASTKLVEAGIVVLILGFAASAGWSLYGPPARVRAARPEPPQREMARAAGEVLRLMQEQEDIGGRALTPEFVESKLEWSRRRVFAVRDSDPTPQEELEAIRAHRDLAARMLAQIEGRCLKSEVSLIPDESLKYFIAEAELWLAKAEGRCID